MLVRSILPGPVQQNSACVWAERRAGTWDFQPAFDCLEDFLESVLDVPKTQEYETAYPYHYIRLIVTGISDTKKALVFLKQHFGDSSFQQTKDRLKELPLLIYSRSAGTAPLTSLDDRYEMMYEKQQNFLEVEHISAICKVEAALCRCDSSALEPAKDNPNEQSTQ